MGLLKWKNLPLLTLLVSISLFYYQESFELSQRECNLLRHSHYWITSQYIVTPQGVIAGAVEVKKGNIVSIIKGNHWHGLIGRKPLIDYGEAVVMPGLFDVLFYPGDAGHSELLAHFWAEPRNVLKRAT